MRAFDEVAEQAFEAKTVSRILSDAIGTVPTWEPDQLRELVSDAVRRAKAFGFRTNGTLSTFVDIDIACPGFERFDWARDILAQQGISEQFKCDKLRIRAAVEIPMSGR